MYLEERAYPEFKIPLSALGPSRYKVTAFSMCVWNIVVVQSLKRFLLKAI